MTTPRNPACAIRGVGVTAEANERGMPASGAAVCAVVVTYHADDALAARLELLIPQVGSIIIVDNGSTEDEVERLRAMAREPKILLVLNSENLGVASALNGGIQRAVELNYRWVVLLDQDSRVERDMIAVFLAIYADFPERDRLAVIGSGYMDRPSRLPAAQAPNVGALWERTESVITSGSFLPLGTHACIGPFRDDYFIDYVDTEYCLRANAKGYSVIQSRRPLLAHAIGASTEHRLLWVTKRTTNHSPDRRYYMARNTTVLLREYGNYRWGGWASKGFQRGFRLCKRILLYESNKAQKIAAVMEGWWDGVRGRMGRRRARGRAG
ncbi:MAG TPA: glycosyltransferase family 2 protein [Steroidobacteraceae bacterium]